MLGYVLNIAINDCGDALRIATRVTLAANVPVGVDGPPSVVLKHLAN